MRSQARGPGLSCETLRCRNRLAFRLHLCSKWINIMSQPDMTQTAEITRFFLNPDLRPGLRGTRPGSAARVTSGVAGDRAALLGVILLGLVGIRPSTAGEPRPNYSRDIRPILASHCFACHGPDADARKAGLRLDVPEPAQAPLESGATAVVPMHVELSELVRRIETTDAAELMPPPESGKPLSDSQKRLLRDWIAAGAEYSEHWAYRAPTRPAVPGVANTAWVRNPV